MDPYAFFGMKSTSARLGKKSVNPLPYYRLP